MSSKTEEKNTYDDKLERMETAAKVEEPDRVPIAIATAYFPAKYTDISYEEMFYNPNKFVEAASGFAKEFDWDGVSFLRTFESVPIGLSLAGYDPELAINLATFSVLGGGAPHDILKDKYSSLPGRELSADGEAQFALEEPVMKDDEYDDLIEDPFRFVAKTIAPRVYESLGDPSSPKAIGSLIELGQELGKFPNVFNKFIQEMKEVNCPPYYAALAPNPLDFLGAFLRDFDTLAKDLYRKPGKVKKACETLTPVLAKVGKATGEISIEATGSRRVFCPVWYNTYLSPEMFKEFHWPYLKKIVNELVDADFTPLLSLQGRYDHLLDTIIELPQKEVIAWFDKTDLAKAEEEIEDHACLAGGIPSSLLIGGTPEKVKKRVKNVMNDFKEGGGLILSTEFNGIGDAKIENIQAMTEAVREYGQY